jgi:hypothetical protein
MKFTYKKFIEKESGKRMIDNSRKVGRDLRDTADASKGGGMN